MTPPPTTRSTTDKTDRKVKKAYMAESGKEAKELKVEPMPAGGGSTDVKYRGTAKVSKESMTANGTAFDCEKTEMDITMTTGGKDYPSKSKTWVSEKVPFRTIWDESATNNMMKDVKWEGKPTVKGGMVKMWAEKSEMNLTGWGSDAKMSVKLPAPK